MHGKGWKPDVCAPAHSLLTFLVLEPELLLDLLAGEVDGAAELGAVQRLGDVVGAKLLDEREQLLPAAVLVQDLQDVCKACGGEAGGVQVSQAGEGAPEVPCSGHTRPYMGAVPPFFPSPGPLEPTTCDYPELWL